MKSGRDIARGFFLEPKDGEPEVHYQAGRRTTFIAALLIAEEAKAEAFDHAAEMAREYARSGLDASLAFTKLSNEIADKGKRWPNMGGLQDGPNLQRD